MTVRRVLSLAFGSLLLAGVGLGCGGAKKAYVPVDSPLREFEPPEEEEPEETEEEPAEEEGDGSTPAAKAGGGAAAGSRAG